jgi:hypothetical protein
MKGRKAGGRTDKGDKEVNAGGNPYVFGEAEKKKRGGKVHDMHGAKAKHHLGKPGRRAGGRVGANTSPLSTAHKGVGGHGSD